MAALYGDVPEGWKFEHSDHAAIPAGGLAYWSQRLLTANRNVHNELKKLQPTMGWGKYGDSYLISSLGENDELLLDPDPDSELPV
jgi:hypothetical protein